ncbi:MAG TPA: hypothetical protein VIR65_08090 [Rhizorhapis sp.]
MVRQTQHRSYQTRAAAAAAAVAVEQLAGAQIDRLIEYCVRPGIGFRSRADECDRSSSIDRYCTTSPGRAARAFAGRFMNQIPALDPGGS